MENIREIVRENLVRFRKEKKLTQIELAEKIGYSDKAISRWETGEVTPDVETLNSLAELYGIKIAAFFEKDAKTTDKKSKEKKAKKPIKISKKFTVSLISIVSVWLLAIVVFALISAWEIFIWATPVSFLLMVIFNSIWGKRMWTVIFSSLLSWTLILATYLQFLSSNPWILWVAGVPVQIVLILSFLLKTSKKAKALENQANNQA